MRPGLTLLCFTRDAAPKLMRLLNSVQGVVDDIVVVDTGSNDLSKGIAMVAGARVYELPWPGSFAEVFNYAIPLVETEWSIRLDTDEWLMPNSATLLRKAMAEPTAVGYNLIREDQIGDGTNNEIYQVRMWRTDHRLRFEGLIHEYVPPDLMRTIVGSRKIYNLPVRFGHDGYEGGLTREKLLRNVDLLRKELELRPGRLYFQIDLARALIELGDPEGRDMISDLIDGILLAGTPPGQECVADLLISGLELIPDTDLTSLRANLIVQRGLEWHCHNPAMLWSVASFERRRGNSEQSRAILLSLKELTQNVEIVRRYGFRSNSLEEIDREIDSLNLDKETANR